MEAHRRKLMQENLAYTSTLATTSSFPRPTVPLPRRNATPVLTPSRKDLRLQRTPATLATVLPPESSPSAPTILGSATSPSPRAVSPEKLGNKPSVPHITCKGWEVKDLLESHRNFCPIRRISALAPSDELLQELIDYEQSGVPLIIEGWHKHPRWEDKLLGIEWLLANVGNKEVAIRNIHDRKDTTMTVSQFVERSRSQDVHHVPGETERCYWKDGECPGQWKDWLHEVLPTTILPGSRDDLLRHLFPSEAVETLLCYLGIGDTYTPAHKDLCASSGHNLMCFSENGGSSFWFMTKSNAAPEVAKYFQKRLGQELDWETHVTTVDEWGNAQFNVYVAEQNVGDLVLVPTRSVHQVVNRGGLAMKTSWSRMTLANLKTALWSELPIYRRVCRLEQYRVKTVLYRSLLRYTEELRSAIQGATGSDSNEKPSDTGLVDYGSPIDSHDDEGSPPPMVPPETKELSEKLFQLIPLFDDVLQQEYASCHDDFVHITHSETSSRWPLLGNSASTECVHPSATTEQNGYDSKGLYNLACDFCGADIFQSFFECRQCRADNDNGPQIGDGLLVCPACYVEGRTCSCDHMHPRQCRPFDVLLQGRNEAASVLANAAYTGGDIRYPLEESHLRASPKIRVFEAACALQVVKNQRTPEKLNSTRRCRVGGATDNTKNHVSNFMAGLNCPKCHAAKCYVHLIQEGTHSSEGLLASYVDDVSYHEVHTQNKAATKQQPPVLYDVKGPSIRDRLVVAAISFPKCKPGHSKLQLGWYDEEMKVAAPVDDVTGSHPAQPISQLTDREDSPLTPVSSPGAKNSDSPTLPNHPRSAPRRSKRSLPAETDNDSVISIDSDSDDHRDEPAPVTRSSSSVKGKPNRAYVQLISRASLRRTSSPASVNLEQRPKKRRFHKKGEDAEGNTMSTRPTGPRMSVGDKSALKTTRGPVGQSFGTDLASALSYANSMLPLFTQSTLPGQRRAQPKGGLRRIISPDPERSVSPPIGNEPSHSRSRLTGSVSAMKKFVVASQGPQTSMLSSTRTAASPRARDTTNGQQFSFDISAGSSSALEQAPAAHVPRKRKKGPPGVRGPYFEAHLKRVKEGDELAENTRKKARHQEMECDDVIAANNTPDLPIHSQQPPSPSQRAASQVISTPNIQSDPSPLKASDPSPPKASSSSLSLTVSAQTVNVLQEEDGHPPTSLRPNVPPEDTSSVPGSSQLGLLQRLGSSGPSAVSLSTKGVNPILSGHFRTLADSIDSLPEFSRPPTDPELDRTMQGMKDEIKELRAQLEAAQSHDRELQRQFKSLEAAQSHDELQRRVKSLEDDNIRLHESLLKERTERSLTASYIRQLEEKQSHFQNLRSPEAMESYVRQAVEAHLPQLHASLQEFAYLKVQECNSVVLQERLTVLHGASATPMINPARQQIESGVHIPQGPAADRAPQGRHFRGGGPQRSYGSRSQDESPSRRRDGRHDGGGYRGNSRSHDSGQYGRSRDDDGQPYPGPTGPGGADSSRPTKDPNNWVGPSRRHGTSDNRRSRRADSSPRRHRSRTPDHDRAKEREPTLDYITRESTPRLRTAKWDREPTSSIGQFDDGGDAVRAVGGSSTDPELSPIESFAQSEKSRSYSEVQESSFTERDVDARDGAGKPPTEPTDGRQIPSPKRDHQRSKSRPIRQ